MHTNTLLAQGSSSTYKTGKRSNLKLRLKLNTIDKSCRNDMKLLKKRHNKKSKKNLKSTKRNTGNKDCIVNKETTKSFYWTAEKIESTKFIFRAVFVKH